MEARLLKAEERVEDLQLRQAEEALCPGIHDPVRKRLVSMIEAYRPLAEAHIAEEHPRLARKNNQNNK